MRYFHIPTIPFFSLAHVFLSDMVCILHNSKCAREIFCKDWDPLSAMQISMHVTFLCSSSRRITFLFIFKAKIILLFSSCFQETDTYLC